jgi:WD40 repeat protein
VVTRTPYPASTNTNNDRVRVWDVETDQLVNEFHGEPTALKHVSISPDESRAILQYHDGVAVLWNIESARRLALCADYTDRGGRLRLSPDGNSLVQVFSTVIKIWDVAEQSIRKVVFQKDQNFRRTVAISPDSQNFAVELQALGIEIRDLHTGEVTAQIPGAYGGAAFAFNQTGKRIAAYDGSNLIAIYEINNPQRREILKTTGDGDSPSVHYIAFSDHDRYLAASDGNRRIHLWQQKGGKYVPRYS